jgi:hypothetical protein
MLTCCSGLKIPNVGQGTDFAERSQNSGGQVNGARSNGDIVLLYEGHCLLKGRTLAATSIFRLTVHINEMY